MEGFKRLEEIGSKSISSTTHIPVAHVENILSKAFLQFQKPQFFGFISILEREYKLDLSDLKQEYLFAKAEVEVPDESSFDIAETGSKVFASQKELFKNKKVVYGAGAIFALLIIIGLISMLDFSSTEEEKIEINNTAIDKAKKNLNIAPPQSANVEDMMRNNTVESAEHGQEEQVAQTSEERSATSVQEVAKSESGPVMNSEPMMPLYFRIVPKGRLWLGIIDTETHRRRVETISEPLILDAEKSWLIVTGYGHLDMDCGDTTTKYREDKKLLFLYESGVCQVIDKEEFKARNRGKLW